MTWAFSSRGVVSFWFLFLCPQKGSWSWTCCAWRWTWNRSRCQVENPTPSDIHSCFMEWSRHRPAQTVQWRWMQGQKLALVFVGVSVCKKSFASFRSLGFSSISPPKYALGLPCWKFQSEKLKILPQQFCVNSRVSAKILIDFLYCLCHSAPDKEKPRRTNLRGTFPTIFLKYARPYLRQNCPCIFSSDPDSVTQIQLFESVHFAWGHLRSGNDFCTN